MKIDQTTLATLSMLQITDNRAVIVEALDRAAYTKVNKVLEAIGGKWSRKDKVHVFPSDAASLVDSVIDTGSVETARDVGFFETPLALATQLVRMACVSSKHRCLEPSAGTGRIVDALLAMGADVWAVERDRARLTELTAKASKPGSKLRTSDVDDFMSYEPTYGNGSVKSFDRIVMNPPFAKVGLGDHLDHVRHAAEDLLAPGGILVSVLPSSVTFRRDKRHVAFRAWVDRVGGTITPLPEGSFKASGTGVNTVVLTIGVVNETEP